MWAPFDCSGNVAFALSLYMNKLIKVAKYRIVMLFYLKRYFTVGYCPCWEKVNVLNLHLNKYLDSMSDTGGVVHERPTAMPNHYTNEKPVFPPITGQYRSPECLRNCTVYIT